MSRQNKGVEGRVGSLIVTTLFILVGVVTLYDATGYTDRDSKVFPQTIAIVLILAAGASLVMQFLKPSPEEGFGRGVWWRRVLMIATMFATCLAMPVIGFLAAAGIAFLGGLIAAMHDRWTVGTILLYGASGAVVMTAFFSMFKYVLFVPLP